MLGAREPDALDDPHEALRAAAGAAPRARARPARTSRTWPWPSSAPRTSWARTPAPAASTPALFEHDAERELHDGRGAASSGSDGGYEARLRALAGLRAPVDRFFDDVLVMAEDPQVRANRLGLLAQTLSLFYRIADISKLGG